MRIFLNTTSLFSRHKILIGSILFLALYSSALIAFATPPGSPFTAGETNDPSCGPTDTNCYVGGSSLIGQTSSSGTETWLGYGAGASSASDANTIFIGINAGYGATGALNAIIMGQSSGALATGANSSVIIGDQAGYHATDAAYSVFSGYRAGHSASNAYNAVFIGGGVDDPLSPTVYQGAGDGATNSYESVFIGNAAGYGATDSSQSVFIGSNAGTNASNAADSNFIGRNAGYGATNAANATFIGESAGTNATEANGGTFIGTNAGGAATNADGSTFIGFASGLNATNAANSVFIGHGNGSSDTVDNTVSGFSILIGNNLNTGGFQNSILLGGNSGGPTISNTAANQFMLVDTITKARWRGVEYTFPSSQGVASSVLTNNGSGVLSWGGVASQWTTAGSDIYYNTGNVGIGDTTPDGKLDIEQDSGVSHFTIGDTARGVYFYSGAYGGGGQTPIYMSMNSDEGFLMESGNSLIGFNDSYVRITESGSDGFAASSGGSTMGDWNSGGNLTRVAVDDTNEQITLKEDLGLIIRGVTYQFPADNGNSGEVLTTNGLGTLTWAAGGGGGSLIGATSDIDTETWLGDQAGANSATTSETVFIGLNAGDTATGATGSIFLGSYTGNGATDAIESNFIGYNTGDSATDADHSNFIGRQAGSGATFASYSNFIGYQAGYNAPNASSSIFIGYQAGNNAADASTSIFIGNDAGISDTVDNSGGSTSILIGDNTSTGGFSDSIALGAGATNTASNEFMIGSSGTLPIETTIFTGATSTCTITTGTGIACSSDQRLKTNIEDLHTNILDTLLSVRTVTYNWNAKPNDEKMIGFLAQDLEQYFPELVVDGADGYKSVYYSQMTPVLVEAIRELNLKLSDITNLTEADNSLVGHIRTWLADAANGIGELFAQIIRSKESHTDKLCVSDQEGETCLTRSQIDALLQGQNTGQGTFSNPPPSETPPTDQNPSVEGVPPTEEIPPMETTPPDQEVIPPPVTETPPQAEIPLIDQAPAQ